MVRGPKKEDNGSGKRVKQKEMMKSESKKNWARISFALLLFVLVFSTAIPLLTSDAAKSTTPTLNKSLCNSLDGIWKAGKAPTCTISSSVTVFSSFTIPAKVTLLLASNGTLDIKSASIIGGGTTTGTIINNGKIIVNLGGTIIVQNSAQDSEGIRNFGTLTNAGSVIINSSATSSVYNVGNFTNSGTVRIENPSNSTEGLNNVGTFTNSNSGTVMVNNSGYGSSGFLIAGSLYNYGSITFQNSGNESYGAISEDGSIINSGTISISNTGTSSYGIESYGSTANFSNTGTILVENSGAGSYGIENDGGTFTNFATGTITIGGGGDNSYGIDNYGNFTNAGTITINALNSSVGGPIGIANEATSIFVNSGTITNNQLDYYGIYVFGGTFTNNGTINNYGAIYSEVNWNGSGTCIDIDSGYGCPV